MEGTYLEILPPEILSIIFSYLQTTEIYYVTGSLAFIRKNINLMHDVRVDLSMVKNLFKRTPGMEYITEINLNGIYWIPAVDIRSGLRKLINLERLYLFDTKMDVTKADVKVYLDLKKLKTLAVTKNHTGIQSLDPTLKKLNLDYFFYNTKDGSSLRWKQFDVFYVLAMRQCATNSRKHKIYNSNWLDNVLKFSANKSEILNNIENYKRSIGIQTITHADFIGTDEEILSKFEKLEDVHHLVIEKSSRTSYPRSIPLDPIKYIKLLVKLEIFVSVHINSNFLETIFTHCRKLKFLKIKNENSQMNLVHLRIAPELEHLSYETAYPFNLERLFTELHCNPVLKLRRLYLNYGMGRQKVCLASLSKYLTNNPQLYCFILVVEVTLAEIKQIQEILTAKVKKPHQYFRVMREVFKHDNNNYVVDDIPTAHYDMFDTVYEVVSSTPS